MQHSASPPNSATADLLLVSSRLSLSRLHRARKLRYLYPSQAGASSPIPSLVQPLLRVWRYSNSVARTQGTLELFATILRDAGLEASVFSRFAVEDEEDDDGKTKLKDLLRSGGELDVLSCSLELDLEQRCVSASVCYISSS